VSESLKTFLIADVRGYSRFTERRGDEAAGMLATRFADITETRAWCAGSTSELGRAVGVETPIRHAAAP
jgi:class 3 adenylate cyclase